MGKFNAFWDSGFPSPSSQWTKPWTRLERLYSAKWLAERQQPWLLCFTSQLVLSSSRKYSCIVTGSSEPQHNKLELREFPFYYFSIYCIKMDFDSSDNLCSLQSFEHCMVIRVTIKNHLRCLKTWSRCHLHDTVPQNYWEITGYCSKCVHQCIVYYLTYICYKHL